MLSIIVCSRNAKLPKTFVKNIAETVGVDYELINIDNSKIRYSIYSAYNEGLTQSKFPYLCFVHDDVLFHDKNWGEKIIAHLQLPDIGIIGVAGGDIASRVPAMWSALNPCQNIIQSDNSGKKLPELIRFPENYNQSRRSVVLLDGVFLCMKRAIFNKIKFDETLGGFHGYDYDIAIQSIIAGFRNYVIYDITIEHFSQGVQDAAYNRTLINVFRKWENYLPLFEKSISKEDQEKLLPAVEEKRTGKLLKRLVRTRFKTSEIVEIITYYTNLTGSKRSIEKLKLLKLNILIIYISSIFRGKMHCI